ncbi:BCD family MFS transporter [Yoonia litorea]|uniref:MFS transporter, BCD family, chlorophyll transporter n=1 Tax=Yoonia litorea TaxID=1123755 RepID=A0A1I6MUD5_9RHOB|nr:BCD family MFS transporter [Yoonia litorea]SFS19322.1 MFS transporter, BCD family, chlorophyll transporter [Yoonia litorea]
MLSWFQIVRLGFVQMALGAIVVLTTSTLNRVMVVELSLPAILPGLLVGLHYGIQLTRPHWGFYSDAGGHRTRWIIGGMIALGTGAFSAALALLVFPHSFAFGLTISVIAYTFIGLGVGAAGTSMLALLATTTHPDRRAAAATITWLMMIFGIAMTAGIVGQLIDPYTPALLLKIVASVCVIAVATSALAVLGIERKLVAVRETDPTPFMEGLKEVWAERKARNFTIFVFLSMTAYFMQELILEPYAGLVFGYTPGQSTSLSGAQNGGVFLGMLTVGIMATGLKIGALRNWVMVGCLGSAAALSLIAGLGPVGPSAPLLPAVVILGFFNGMFAVAAIGSMMALAGDGVERREGTRMGLWGAAQAIAAGFGGLLGAACVDVLRVRLPDSQAFGTVFLVEAAIFLAATAMAAKIMDRKIPTSTLVPGE